MKSLLPPLNERLQAMKISYSNFRQSILSRILWIVAFSMFLGLTQLSVGLASEPVNPLTREHTIMIDSTALDPPTWWQVPGATPLIWLKDPQAYDSFQTTEARELKLKPGEYQFGTFTFNFSFLVNLDGQLEFDESLALCVDGRGTHKLVIKCTHTQPYKQQPDYNYSNNN